MKIPSASPERGTFSLNNTRQRAATDNTLAERLDELTKIFQDSRARKLEQEQDPAWQKDNLEYQLRTTDWILEKVRTCDIYAQNLYAAMCNNDFVKILDENTPETIDKILRDDIPKWSCSWRYAGGIIADMQGKGDYIDWYCSGIRDFDTEKVQDTLTTNGRKVTPESTVTDEIRSDIKSLGWIIITDQE